MRGDENDKPLIVVCLPKRVLAEAASDKLKKDFGINRSKVGYRHGQGQMSYGEADILFCTAGWLWAKSVDEE